MPLKGLWYKLSFSTFLIQTQHIYILNLNSYVYIEEKNELDFKLFFQSLTKFKRKSINKYLLKKGKFHSKGHHILQFSFP